MTETNAVAVDHRQRCKGYLQSYVARAKQPRATVAATIETIARKHAVSPAELHEMVKEIRQESVEPFFGPPYYNGPERRRRLDEIGAELRRRGVL